MDVFNLQAKLGLDTAAFSSTLTSAVSMGISKVGDFARQGSRYLSDFAKDSVATGMQFDSSMAQVAATMGATIDEVSELRDYARKMGATTAFSASQAADALNYMALAGYDAEQSMAMLPNVLNLAAAGSIDLAYASDMVTDAQSALGLTAEETTELVDKMATAASNSNTSVAQLGSAILTVGGTAKNLKGGTTELATVLGILADNGIKGAEGGTALRNMLNTLAAPTGDAAVTLEQLGVAVYDAEGNMRSLNDVFGDMKNGLSQLTQQQRMQAISNIFNVRDMKSAEAILGSVGDRFNELSAAIDNASGAAAQMAETQLDTLAGDKTKFESALEGIKLSVSDALTPALREAVQFGTKWLGRITKGIERGDPLSVARAIAHMLKNGAKEVRRYVSEVVPVVYEEIIKPIGSDILRKAPKLINSLSNEFVELMGNASNFLNGIDFKALGETIATFLNQIDWSEIVKSIGSFLATAVSKVPDFLSGFIKNIDFQNAADLAAIIFVPKFIGTIATAITSSSAFTSVTTALSTQFSVSAGAAAGSAATTFMGMFAGALVGWEVGTLIRDAIGGEKVDEVVWPVIDNWLAGLDELKKEWDEFLSLYTAGWDALGDAIGAVGDAIDKVVGKIKQNWEFWEGFGEYLATPKSERNIIDSNADGGYVTTPRLSWVAEKEPEYIIPESKMDKVFKNSSSGYTFNFYYQGGNGMSDAEIEEQARRLADLSIAQIRAIGGTGF